MIEIKNPEVFNVIDFLERNIKINIKKIHKKYLDKLHKSKEKAGILFLTVYERNITSITFIRTKGVFSGITFEKNYIKLKFPNIFNSKEKSNIEKFEKYMLNHLNKIKSNILKNDMIDEYLIDLSIENYMRSYQPFYSQTLFNKKDIVKYLDNLPNILQQKYDKFVNNADKTDNDELYDEIMDSLQTSAVFLNKTYYEYYENKDYYDTLINTLDIICKNKDLMHFMFDYWNVDDLNFIDDILYQLMFKNKKSEVFIKQVLQTKNVNLILFLIDTVLYDIDMNDPIDITDQHKKHIEAIKKYFSSYKIEVSKSYGYEKYLSFLEIDYKIIDDCENKLILK